ncbi:MAG: DNA polymerase III subunit gamma/tau [Oscillospiraceae bacterium]|nr:DNA polymerase III subunit gamma/tau [Oscillospiraceae bacterium]
MYQALYRKYRPQTFDDVVGQTAITATLKAQVMGEKTSHAYLFTGTRGTGKTSCAKVLAKAVNCLNPQNGNPCNCCDACRAIDAGSCVEVLEIDAASNNGVDQVRTLRDEAVYAPAQVKKRVYIVDEVHMLSISAFNALLKIIEEPPAHLMFILATTELQKVPATILSRCQRFSFRRLRQEDIAARISYVAYQEKIDLTAEAASLLARLADGAMRDGLTLLDQVASGAQGEITADEVCRALGLAGEQKACELLSAVAAQDASRALAIFGELYAAGKDLSALLGELAALTRDLLLLKTAPQSGLSMLSGIAMAKEQKPLMAAFSAPELLRVLSVIQRTTAGFAVSTDRRLDTELCLMELCSPVLTEDVQALSARLGRLEEKLAAGTFTAAPAPKQETAEKPVQKEKPIAPKQPDAPKETAPTKTNDLLPADFRAEFFAKIAPELSPAARGFFSVQGPFELRLQDGTLYVETENDFALNIIGDKDRLAPILSEKASALRGAPTKVCIGKKGQYQKQDDPMQELLQFGKNHEDIVKIRTEEF